MIKRYGFWVLALLPLLILGLIVWAYFHYKIAIVFTTYPQIHKLSQTDKLICEPLMSTSINLANTCDGKDFWSEAVVNKEMWLQEGRRLTSGSGSANDPWEWKKEWGKPNKLWRRDKNIIYTKSDMLIQDLEDKAKETAYQIVKETETKLIAQTFSELGQNTSIGTLFLDKEKGIVIFADSSNWQTCADSLHSNSQLFSCRER